MKKVLNLIVLVTLILVIAACGLTAKKTGSKKSSISVVAPAPVTYTLSVAPNTPKGGSVSVTPELPQHVPGTVVELEAIPKTSDGWSFEKWILKKENGANEDFKEGEKSITINMNENKIVVARFIHHSKQLWDLTVLPCMDDNPSYTPNPDFGTVSKDPDQSEYVVDEDVVTLKAKQKNRTNFLFWDETGGASAIFVEGVYTNETIKIKMNSPASKIFKAVFFME